jgi:hypothetical protein
MSARGYFRGARGWVLAGIALVALFVVLGELFGGEPHGPVSSSYATDGQGLAAWATLLERNGHPVVRLRKALDEARLDPRASAVVLDPEALLRAEGARLRTFMSAGGRLLIGGSDPQRYLDAVLHTPPAWAPASEHRVLPSSAPDTTLAGISEVRSAGAGQWQEDDGYQRVLATGSGGAVLMKRGFGSGSLLLFADVSMLQNRLLASADNAQLALNLAGGPRRTVVFVESVHGFGESRGLAALPASWWTVFAGLLLAGLVWALGRSRRLGAAQPLAAGTGGAGAPARGEYVDALARLLRRAGPADELRATADRRAESARPVRLRDRG